MKNLATHVVAGVIVLTVGFASGSAYHAQQVHNRQVAAQKAAAVQKAHDAEVASEKAAALKAEEAQAAAVAAQKAKTGVTKTPLATPAR